MGVPKFYRWISERYPCLSEVVREYQMPDFDNLYLDMNGIIHNCSHPNDEDPHFRISEEKIFLDIFHYIEFLFRTIKPQKVFFMAIDGVAPRAKMNQQRGRRFRTAKEAELKEAEAISKGEILPSEERFDTNCITPGTPFMARLHTQLQYFVTMKISTDKTWQGCKVYLSGHETPGEGEHKIMDYIRYCKSQTDYDANTKHCLYGLDADLIMLGLCSHEPHFALLREEVKFGGRKNDKKILLPEMTTFHLLHLSLLREYLELEFSPVKPHLNFPFDLESIIDDWVLMGFLVGNDFIPNIPQLHIQNDALPLLYQAYIKVLPSLGGYINEKGFLNLERFQKYLIHLASIDREMFKDNFGDFKYLEENASKKKNISKENLLEPQFNNSNNLSHNGQNEEEEESEDSADSDEESEMEFVQHKRDYYINKMEYTEVNEEVLKEQTYQYVLAIQWNLHYYYNGIVSWSWFYPFHYAPYISDVTNFSELKLEFEYGKPFLPFQQLLAVLPAASRKLLPAPYQKLMLSEASPIKSYYPTDFKTDQNGKQQEWEAVVLIPFIDEKTLVSSMDPLYSLLTEEEKQRNVHGPNLLFTYSENSSGIYKSPNSNALPDINFNHARCTRISPDEFMLPKEQILKGLPKGARLDVFIPGFPSLRHIKHSSQLKKGKVKVFQMASRGESMFLTLLERKEMDLNWATELIGQVVFIEWPHLTEAKVYAVSDGTISRFAKNEECSLNKDEKIIHKRTAQNLMDKYAERFAINIGPVQIILHVHVLTGQRYKVMRLGEIILEKLWSPSLSQVPLQCTVKDIPVHEAFVRKLRSVDELFPSGSLCFMLGHPCYGSIGKVLSRAGSKNDIKLSVKFATPKPINLDRIKCKENSLMSNQYMTAQQLAQHLGVSNHLISRITGTIFIDMSNPDSSSNNKMHIGLNLKFNKRNEEVNGYSRRNLDGVWLFSHRTLEVLNDYIHKFPELISNLCLVLEKDEISVDTLFRNKNGREYMKKVKLWLESQPCMAAEKQPCGAEVLDPAIVEAIEKVVDENKSAQPTSLQLEVKPEFLYRPDKMQGNAMADPHTTFQLYDRVVFIREGCSVPLGLHGIIIGIRKGENVAETMYDVLFDEEFVGAVIFNATTKRCYRLFAPSLLNLSHGARVASSKQKNSIPRNHNDRRPSSERNGSNLLYSQALSQANESVRNPQKREASIKKSGMTVLSGVGKKPSRQQSRNKQFQQKEVNSSKSSSFDEDPEMINILQRATSPVRERNAATELEIVTSEQHGLTNHFNHSPDSPFVPHNTISASSQFSFESDSNGSSPYVSSPSTSSQNMTEGEFSGIWNDMQQMQKKSERRPQDIQPPSNQGGPKRTSYGTQLSVEELFKTAQQSREPTAAKVLPAVCAPSYSVELFHILKLRNAGSPKYSITQVGPMGLSVAVLTLPDQRTFYSVPCSTQQHAMESAAETALATLKCESTGYHGYMSTSHAMDFQGLPPQSMAPRMFRPAFTHSSPSLSMAARVLPKAPLDLSVSRRPPPSLLSNIPSDFMAHNQRIMEQEQLALAESTHRQGYNLPINTTIPPPTIFNNAVPPPRWGWNDAATNPHGLLLPTSQQRLIFHAYIQGLK